jgi:hypothetical protein
MPRTRNEGDKKHGDELQSLIERTGGDPSPRDRKESADDDEPELVPDDEDRALLDDDEDEDEDEDEVEDQDDDFESHDPD